jgi:hypothetical protein
MASCDACQLERGPRRGVVPATGFGRAMLCAACYAAAAGVREETAAAVAGASAKFLAVHAERAAPPRRRHHQGQGAVQAVLDLLGEEGLI